MASMRWMLSEPPGSDGVPANHTIQHGTIARRACGTTPSAAEFVLTPTKEVVMAVAKGPVPQGFHTVTPHLIFDKAAEAIGWYKRALGAEEKMSSAGPD